MINGTTEPAELAKLASGRLKASRAQLIEALRGAVREHHRFLIKLHLEQIDGLNNAVRELEARVGEELEPPEASSS